MQKPVTYVSKPIQAKLPLLFPLIFILCAASISAANISVSSRDDSGAGTLREAIVLALPGDSIHFLIDGEIVLDSQIVINKNLNIVGPGPDQLALTTRDSTRLLLIERGDTVYISGLRFYQGNATKYLPPSGGAISNLGVLTLGDCIFHDNIATLGGAIENQGFGASSNFLSVSNCSFYDNLAIQPIPGFVELGGAIYADGRGSGVSEIEIFNSTFARNKAKISGGAIYAVTDAGGVASLAMSNCTVAYNWVEGRCGGVDVSQAHPLQLKNSLIANNTGRADRPDLFGAMLSGGNNVISDTGMTVLVNSLSSDVLGVDAGLGPFGLNGGIFPTVSLACGSPALDAGDDLVAPLKDLRGQARVGQSDIGAYERNEETDLKITTLANAGWGSLRQAIALSCPGDTLRLDNISGIIGLRSSLVIQQDQVIIGNPQDPVFLSGGDSLRILYVEPGIALHLDQLNFEKGNPQNFGGGAIMNKGSLTLSNSSFRLNTAKGGGAIANYGDLGPVSLQIDNCSFADNSALFLDGGAVDNRPFSHGASARLTHCSFALNQSENHGGAVFNAPGGELTIINSLFGGNFAINGTQLYGKISTEGVNLVQDTAGIVWNNAVSSSTLLVDDPLLSPLDYYGGSSLSFRLLPGSPAIDAGNNTFATAFDQRGEARIFNEIVDLGAYEYDPATGKEPGFIENPILLYPQPSTGAFILQWPEAAQQNLTYHLFDLQGKRIRQQTIQLDAEGKYVVREATISPGFYVITLQNKRLKQSIRLQIIR